MTKSTTKRIILLFFCLIPILSKGQINLDSLVKTHKKVALLPVKVMYSYKKLPEGQTLKDVRNKEFEDGFLLQEKFIKQLYKDSVHVIIEIQSFNETNNLLSENEITLQDLKDLPADFICESLKVDAIIETEIRLNTHITDTERAGYQTLAVAGMIVNPLNAISVFRGPRKVGKNSGGRDDKNISSKMTISDGRTNEIVKDFFVSFDGSVFNSSDKLIENVLWENFKKSPYYKK
jgi:hypothetical protein